MTQSNSTTVSNATKATFGFLTVVKLESLGHCGGLLVVSQIGRPIEFHCTAPVGTNRAQEIMYGQTYNGFLYSDQIGMALIDKTKSQPTMYATDCPNMLPITEQMDAPLIYAESREADQPFDGRGLTSFSLKRQNVFCVNVKADQVTAIRRSVELFAGTLPIDEPFERIRQAIEEAHTGLRAA